MENTDLVISNYFSWKKFSNLEVLRYKFQTFLLEIICKYLNNHCWSIELEDWQLTKIETLESFKKHNAKMLKCDFCMVEKLYSEVEEDLTINEIRIYNYQVEKIYSKKMK